MIFDEGHYVPWRAARLAVVKNAYRSLAGKRVLELGCGLGHVGRELASWGADVTVSDARQEYVEEALRRGCKNGVVYDVEQPWPDELGDGWDLIIHWGLLYHTVDLRAALQCVTKAKETCLECEVCDSDHPDAICEVPEYQGGDQAAGSHRRGRRPSATMIENLLDERGVGWARLDSPRLNAAFHRYDWECTNHSPAAGWEPGLRRFWFVARDG